LGFGGCDVDLGIYFDDVDVDAQGQFSPQERVELLATACARLSSAFQVQEFVRNARVPVIKLWDPKRQVKRRGRRGEKIDGDTHARGDVFRAGGV